MMLDQDNTSPSSPTKTAYLHAAPTSATSKTSPLDQQCDKILINHVQDAIKTIKNSRQQCNIKSIFTYLREKMPTDEKIAQLTENELMRQLELGVREGILSRKFGSDYYWQHKSPVKNSNQTTYSLPLINDTDSSSSSGTELKKKQLNDLLTILIKSIAVLNKQNFSIHDKNSENNETETTCSLISLCKYLNESYKFQLDNNNETSHSSADDIQARLNECIHYLLTSNEKIFVKVKTSDELTYKLNSNYIQKKLKQQQQLKSSPLKSDTDSSPVKFKSDSILARHLTVEFIAKNFNFFPPYSAEQILKIESVKRPASLDESHSSAEKKKCSYCVRVEGSNPLGRFDEFITCADCGSSAHSYCLKYSSDLIQFIRANKLKWQCYECKLCSVCLKTSENIVLCDKCDRGYHKECCQPALKRPKSQFICHVCKQLSGESTDLKSSTTAASKASTKKRKLSTNSRNSLESNSSLNKTNKENKKLKKDEENDEKCTAENDEEEIPATLGLIDGMSKFFTPNSTQRHHQFNFYAAANFKMQSSVSNNNHLVAKKILKRSKNSQRNKQISSTATLATSTANSNQTNDQTSNSLNNSDKENQFKSPVKKSPSIMSANNSGNKKTSLLFKMKLSKSKLKQKQTNSRNHSLNNESKSKSKYELVF